MADEIITQYLIPSSNAIPTVSDPHAPVGSFLRRNVLLHPFVEKDTVTVDGQERERVIIRMLPDYMTNPYVHKFVMYMVAEKGCTLAYSSGINPDPSISGSRKTEGFTLSRDGKTLFLGAPTYNLSKGIVYVYDVSQTSNPILLQTITPPTALADYSFFGLSIEISADDSTLVVGQPTHLSAFSPTPSSQGLVHIYSKSAGVWQHSSTLPLPQVDTTGALFGYDVAVNYNGSEIVVGCPYQEAIKKGAVFVYYKIGSSYSLQYTLKAPDKANNDNFGYSVDITKDGERVIIGAPGVTGGYGYGKAYIARIKGVINPPQYISLAPPLPIQGGLFGYKVATTYDGSYIVVGEPRLNTLPDTEDGRVHIFDNNFLQITLQSNDIQPSQYYGNEFGNTFSISAQAEVICVGSPIEEYGQDIGAGKVFVYNNAFEVDEYFVDLVWDTSPQIIRSPNAPDSYDQFGVNNIATSYKGCKSVMANYNSVYVYGCPCSDAAAILIRGASAIFISSSNGTVSCNLPIGYGGIPLPHSPLIYEYMSGYDYYINDVLGDTYFGIGNNPPKLYGHFYIYWGAPFGAPDIPSLPGSYFFLSFFFNDSGQFGIELEFSSVANFQSQAVNGEITFKFQHKIDASKTYEFAVSFLDAASTPGNYANATAPVTKIRNIQGNIMSITKSPYFEYTNKWQII